MLYFLDYFGVIVFAVTGVLAAAHKKLDLFGVLVIAFITALGGGTLRDVVLGAYPVSWVAQPVYLALTTGAALLTFILARFVTFPLRTLAVCDAIGLAFFTVLGTQKALLLGHAAAVSITMGIMTGVAGGVIRDIICNEIPLVFRKEIYATAALAGACVYVLAQHFSLSREMSMVLSMTTALAVRLAAIYRGWSLPAFMLARQAGK